jgi:hypothetical protein
MQDTSTGRTSDAAEALAAVVATARTPRTVTDRIGDSQTDLCSRSSSSTC